MDKKNQTKRRAISGTQPLAEGHNASMPCGSGKNCRGMSRLVPLVPRCPALSRVRFFWEQAGHGQGNTNFANYHEREA